MEFDVDGDLIEHGFAKNQTGKAVERKVVLRFLYGIGEIGKVLSASDLFKELTLYSAASLFHICILHSEQGLA